MNGFGSDVTDRWTRVRLLLLGVGTVFACLGGCSSASDPHLIAVSHTVLVLDPKSASGNVGDSFTFLVTAFDSGERVARNLSVTLVSRDPTIAAVTPSALSTGETGSEFTVKCVGGGTTVIDITPMSILNENATAGVTCHILVPTLVVVDTPPKSNAGAAAVQFHATASDASGKAVAGTAFTWTSANASIATVSSTGLATPLSPGIAVITATTTGSNPVSGTSLLTVTGPGSCSLNPTGVVSKLSLRSSVQSDPGNHAAQIGLPATGISMFFDFRGSFGQQISIGASSPLVSPNGGWFGADCVFVANGTGTIGGQQNVGVRLQGTWTNGTLTLTYTVGTNGELSGGATVYTLTG